MNCTFFGHSKLYENISNALSTEILSLIKNGFSNFWVGNNGQFDYCVQVALKNLSNDGYLFDYSIVISHIGEKALSGAQDKTIFPLELASSLPRFAINKRNQWMIDNSAAIICYVNNKFSNSYKWMLKGQRKKLKIINLTSVI